MKFWFPDFYTEAHRTPERREELVAAMRADGLDPQPQLTYGCEAVFCGTIWRAPQVRATKLPVIHYSWDIYPFQVSSDENRAWSRYIEDLKRCKAVLVPSACCQERLWEYVGRRGRVLLAPVKPWEPPEEPPRGAPRPPFAVDVMRSYPDPEQGTAARVCRRLGIHCVEAKAQLPWDSFRWHVANASLLLSVYTEASTGGLSLLEGAWHGAPALISSSPRNGACDYVGELAHLTGRSMERSVAEAWSRPKLNVARARAHVSKFSDAAFARGVKEALLAR